MPVVDIVLLSVIVLLVVVCCAIESDFVQRYRRKLACAIAGLGLTACTLLFFTDEGSLIIGSFAAEPGDQSSRKPRGGMALADGETGPGREPTGPGDGRGASKDPDGDGAPPPDDGAAKASHGVRPQSTSGAAAEAPDLTADGAARSRATRLSDCKDCPEMVLVPAGELTMGAREDDIGRAEHEGPLRTVRFRRSFFIGRFEVRRDEYERFVRRSGHAPSASCVVGGRNRDGYTFMRPGFDQDGSHPVVCVSWDDAKAYVSWLSRETGRTYRLPSESEWEYVARAGQDRPFVTGDSIGPQDANFGRVGGRTTPAATFLPNAWGVYDMAGNAWELVEDCWNASLAGLPENGSPRLHGTAHVCTSRVMRGGAWYNSLAHLRLAARWANPQGHAGNGVGFRVARNVDEDDPLLAAAAVAAKGTSEVARSEEARALPAPEVVPLTPGPPMVSDGAAPNEQTRLGTIRPDAAPAKRKRGAGEPRRPRG